MEKERKEGRKEGKKRRREPWLVCLHAWIIFQGRAIFAAHTHTHES
jgi:hypothetical protein